MKKLCRQMRNRGKRPFAHITTRLLLLLVLTGAPTAAQKSISPFSQLTMDQGLPSMFVDALYQDSIGFMWIGTAEGLCRYDGYGFTTFRYSATDPQSLSNNQINAIASFDDRTLWLGTPKGLCAMDLQTYRIERVTGARAEPLAQTWVNCLYFISANELVIGTFSDGAFIFDTQTRQTRPLPAVAKGKDASARATIWDIRQDGKSNLWFATSQGLEKYDCAAQQAVRLFENTDIRQLTFETKQRLWATTFSNHDIYAIDPATGLTEKQIEIAQAPNESIKRLYFDQAGNAWLLVMNRGIYFSKGNGGSTDNAMQFVDTAFPSTSPWRLYQDKQHNLWIGTFSDGLFATNNQHKAFKTIAEGALPGNLPNAFVRFVYEDGDGQIWLSTRQNGALSKYNPITQQISNYRIVPQKTDNEADYFVLSITDGGPNYLWLGTLNKGVLRFDKRTGKAQTIQSLIPGVQLRSNSVIAMHVVNNKLWVGYIFNGIDIIDLQTGSIEQLSATSPTRTLCDNRVRAFCRDEQQTMWIGTLNGLSKYTPATGSMEQFLPAPAKPSSLSDNQITGLLEDSRGRFWVGTSNGLNLMDRNTGSFTRFIGNAQDASLNIRGIEEGENGELWLSTDKGISRFDPNTGNFRHYTKSDGLYSIGFNNYAHCKAANGTILFGSTSGLVQFRPGDISQNVQPPLVALTDLRLFNQSVEPGNGSPMQHHISTTQAITLKHDQSVLTIEYVALNLPDAAYTQYAYKLDGFDKAWNHVGAQRTATYTNLRPGRYTFSVIAANNDNVWSPQGRSLTITILPPPWKTWWAYLLYAATITFIIVRYRAFAIKRFEQERQQTMDREKLKLFINVAHEFRTPLTVMLSPLKRIKTSDNPAEISTAADTVLRATQKLLHLVNQLLDFRKLDLGQARLAAAPCDLVQLVTNEANLFDDLARTKNIQITVESPDGAVEVWADADKIEKAVNNLLSNAIKFTNTGGISIVVRRTGGAAPGRPLQKGHGNCATVAISDTGIGMTQEHLQMIFERFYQANEFMPGTGIGLNYTKSLIEMHGGTLTAESRYGKGSTFTFSLPLGRNHLRPDQIATAPLQNNGHETLSQASLAYDIECTDIEDASLLPDLHLPVPDNKQTLLIVEDNKILRQQMRDALSPYFTIKEAANGREGFEKALKFLPDLVISDVMMPEMDGFELCKKIKTEPETSHTPVVLLTARDQAQSRVEGFETGADAYITKPFNIQVLTAQIASILQNRKTLKAKFIAGKLMPVTPKKSTTNHEEAFLDKATKIVLANVENPDFTIAMLYDEMGISQSSFFNKISALTGQNASNFIRTIKLKYAADLLVTEGDSIKEICYRVGFSSPAYFIKTFKDLYGITPGQYIKERTGNDTNIESPIEP